MLRGDDHLVGAASSTVLDGWAEDLTRSVRNVKENSVHLNAIETTYVMLDSIENDVDNGTS